MKETNSADVGAAPVGKRKASDAPTEARKKTKRLLVASPAFVQTVLPASHLYRSYKAREKSTAGTAPVVRKSTKLKLLPARQRNVAYLNQRKRKQAATCEALDRLPEFVEEEEDTRAKPPRNPFFM